MRFLDNLIVDFANVQLQEDNDTVNSYSQQGIVDQESSNYSKPFHSDLNPSLGTAEETGKPLRHDLEPAVTDSNHGNEEDLHPGNAEPSMRVATTDHGAKTKENDETGSKGSNLYNVSRPLADDPNISPPNSLMSPKPPDNSIMNSRKKEAKDSKIQSTTSGYINKCDVQYKDCCDQMKGAIKSADPKRNSSRNGPLLSCS